MIVVWHGAVLLRGGGKLQCLEAPGCVAQGLRVQGSKV